MLLPGCQCCGTCDACTRTCTEPHTGSAFETVYTRFFEGVEVGNPSDGYLNATGDNDTSDPYNGMDGTGPWYQQVGGSFNDGGSSGGGTRFPCTYWFSFWRSSYTLGASTIPPASTALTENVIELTVSSGAVVFPDGRVITAADGAVALSTIPLVSGGAAAVDPRTGEGSVSFALQCQNVETLFSIQARIRWNTQKRQHILYGRVRECYREGEPCSCPSPAVYNDTLYVEISGFTDEYNLGISPSEVNGIYVAENIPSLGCHVWKYPFGVVQPGAISFQTPPLSTTSFGYQSLRYYIWYGMFTTPTTGVSYTCGTGTMATQTVSISLWFIYEFGSSDLNAGTITLRVFK